MTESVSCTQTTPNCASCEKGRCTTCTPGYHLSQGLCAPHQQSESPADKSDPTDLAPSVDTCSTNQECRKKGFGFCDGTSKTCKRCAKGCDTCTSFKFCAECNNRISKPTTLITGECAQRCGTYQQFVYCSISDTQQCNQNSTSQCNCRASQNCAECTDDSKSCKSCLKNMKRGKDGECSECADGLVKIGKICTKDDVVPGEVYDPTLPEPEDNSQNLSGGEVAGILIGVLLVVGAVVGGLAYYFVRRAKKRVEQQ
ncbi:Cysteine-rich membrane protein 1 [Spironucleus salmonicida]|uniref:Cysteine-rich membrane protein 1 n=1 Tax=Spironucleus salmonicida TaxID=348837 RepID=A0A9P8LKA1_9EUKA|nr:Cysteine-rich membrane protein 1 [Spironucleus salmonicida]